MPKLSGFKPFFFFFLCWFLIAAFRLYLVVANGGYSSLQCMASHWHGFSCCDTWTLERTGFSTVACRLRSCSLWALGCGLSSCGTWVHLLLATWDLPGLGMKPMSSIGRWILNHWTTREVPSLQFFVFKFSNHRNMEGIVWWTHIHIHLIHQLLVSLHVFSISSIIYILQNCL